MELPFIYKYQPTELKDFAMDADLLHLIQTLISMNTLNVLFVGNSGSGKTSLIKAIVHAYYTTSSSNGNNAAALKENVLSINSLKEQGITYYRTDVKTFCQTASLISGKKKIVILDDIEIINEQSQQVFRNCIDKYSHNVHFIGSCSNTQKVIDSLQSRMTIVKLKALNLQKMQCIVQKICEKEALHLSPEAEAFILQISNHSVRTAINYLEKFKLLNYPHITLEVATAVCTNISFQDFALYTNCLLTAKDLPQAVKIIYDMHDRGYSVMDILDNYFLFIKTTTLLTEEQKYQTIPYLCKYITTFHNVHEEDIELALFTNNLFKLFAN